MSIEQDKRPRRTLSFRFRIVHLLYVTALVCSALSTFGSGGIVLAAILCAGWGWVFANAPRPSALPGAILLLMLIGCLYGVFAPAFSAVREASRRMPCANNLKQITIALHNYHDVYKSFPPAYVADENGRPIHSWRVLILPFLEQQPLYDAYRFDEPWDGPNNRKSISHAPSVYSCPSHHEHSSKALTHTNYVAVVGDNTAWPGERSIAYREIVDGTVNTLLVCEVGNRRILWMEPTDLSKTEAVAMLTALEPDLHSGHVFQSFFYEWSHGRQIALADGSIKFLVHGIDAHDVELLLAINDYELHDIDNLRGAATKTRRLKIDNCIRLGAFVLLALWPLPWVWINPHGPRGANRLDEEIAADEP